MGRREEKQAANRRRLLEAALVVFSRDGYHGASLADVATEAGLTKGAVYSNFTSKRSLLLEALAYSSSPWSGFAPMPAPELTVADVLRSWGRAYAARIQPESHLVSHLALTHDLQSLIARDVDGMAAYAEVRHLGVFLLARTLEHVALREGRSNGRAMTGVARAALTMLGAAAQARAMDPDAFSVDLAGSALAVLADLDDGQDPPTPPLGHAREGITPLPPLPGLVDQVRGRAIRWAHQPLVLVLLPLQRAREIDPIVRGVRAGDPEVELLVVLTVPDGQEDIAAFAAWNLPDMQQLLLATVPEDHLPDLRLAIDPDGAIARALDVSRDQEDAMALAVRDGMVIARGLGPSGARGVAAVLGDGQAQVV